MRESEGKEIYNDRNYKAPIRAILEIEHICM